MNEVLKHPLAPLPYSLATSDGLPQMTANTTVTLEMEVIKPVSLAESIQMPTSPLIDGMAIVQRIAGDKKTSRDGKCCTST